MSARAFRNTRISYSGKSRQRGWRWDRKSFWRLWSHPVLERPQQLPQSWAFEIALWGDWTESRTASACPGPAAFLQDPLRGTEQRPGEDAGRMVQRRDMAPDWWAACQAAAGWPFVWVCLQSQGGRVPGRVLPLFGKSYVHLACSVACGLSALRCPCHWAQAPRARFLLWPMGDTGPEEASRERVWVWVCTHVWLDWQAATVSTPQTFAKGLPT